MKPKPKERFSLIPLDLAHLHRNPHCPRLRECLLKTAKLGWRSFSCNECPLFGVREPGPGGIESLAWRRPGDERTEFSLWV